MSDEKDILKDLFSEKLENYEAKVNPALWNSIASKIASPAVTSAVVGKTVLSKIIIGSSIAAAVAIGGYIFLTPSVATTTPTKETVVPKEQVSKSNTSKAFVEAEEAVVVSQNKTKSVSIKNTDNQDVTVNDELIPTHSNEHGGEVVTTIRTETTEEIITTIKHSPDAPAEKSVSKTTKTTRQELQKEKQKSDQEDNTIENLPNVFTPNNDGSNDYFSIQSSGVKDFSIVIMDNQNSVVFKSDDANFKWNGVDLKGDQVPEGNYIYYITGYNAKGKVITKYSALKVVR
jgi:gliding motility-associated-like protein